VGKKWKSSKKVVEEEKKWLKKTRKMVKEGEKLLWMRKKVKHGGKGRLERYFGRVDGKRTGR
jgi:hypothetical protein